LRADETEEAGQGDVRQEGLARGVDAGLAARQREFRGTNVGPPDQQPAGMPAGSAAGSS